MEVYSMNPVEWLLFLASLDRQRSAEHDEWLAIDVRVRRAICDVGAFGMSCWRAHTLDLGPLIAALQKPIV